MYAVRDPWQKWFWRKLTVRSALTISAAAFVLTYPIYNVLEAAITHGIHRQGDLLVVDMKAMSDFNLDQVNGQTADIPRAYRDLDGKRVMLAGEMWSPDSAEGNVNRFALVYSIQSCCFVGPPKVQHFVKASVLAGNSVDYLRGVVDAIGTLHVGVERTGGRIESVYRLDVERVRQ